ncbi:SDR family NAD(P)-dependent oxidoreductase [Longitalea luteola]|uniref:SDR family NAD(P)-dependent oxidoreductase n=1 Tax=Longitalea luteola TaxID=2812563 RepID=UPI001A9719B8|nr:SDR family NAD(P)-dependent oxidoreductase [Longitalea luteola]
MARVFITGSADGLGQLAAKALIEQGHQVLLHARNEKRAGEALASVPGAEGVVTADLGNMEQTKQLAAKVNALGRFDAVIHNAGVYNTSAKHILMVNTLAPYILTCLIQRPQRLVYLSSGMHIQGRFEPLALKTGNRITYSDSKLHVVMLCKAVARKWPDVYANALNPGWVPTKMGGPGAPDSLETGYKSQVLLAVSNEAKVKVSGRYFSRYKEASANPQADDVQLQEKLLQVCTELTGVSFPEEV